MKKKKTAKSIIIVFALIFIGMTLWQFNKPGYKTLTIEGKEYKLEIANTPSKREKGLMEREKLKENGGMLFIFPKEEKHSFWMYKTIIPLKIIWFDSNWKIVDVEEKALPCPYDNPWKCPTYSPSKPAKYVVEINP